MELKLHDVTPPFTFKDEERDESLSRHTRGGGRKPRSDPAGRKMRNGNRPMGEE
ncbi:MAG: hypothetical protein ACYC37_05330 [Desulfobacteria bacterium]